jgi:hypothetical protein
MAQFTVTVPNDKVAPLKVALEARRRPKRADETDAEFATHIVEEFLRQEYLVYYASVDAANARAARLAEDPGF